MEKTALLKIIYIPVACNRFPCLLHVPSPCLATVVTIETAHNKTRKYSFNTILHEWIKTFPCRESPFIYFAAVLHLSSALNKGEEDGDDAAVVSIVGESLTNDNANLCEVRGA